MRRATWLLAALAVAAVVEGPRAAGPGRRSAQREGVTPVVVELFTSEGCSSCPPADSLLASLVGRQPVPGAQIIGLGLHVDYWDQLGWKDRFSSAALTNRQQVYGARFGGDSIYTPQMVVDGRVQFVGSDAKQARTAIERAASAAHGVVTIAFDGPQQAVVSVADLPSGTAAPADVVVAITEEGLRSNVTRGENEGRVMAHASVVRYLSVIGEAKAGSGPFSVKLPIAADWTREHLKAVAFVQERRSRVIVAAAAAPVPAIRP